MRSRVSWVKLLPGCFGCARATPVPSDATVPSVGEIGVAALGARNNHFKSSSSSSTGTKGLPSGFRPGSARFAS